jgi:hypothetical protein
MVHNSTNNNKESKTNKTKKTQTMNSINSVMLKAIDNISYIQDKESDKNLFLYIENIKYIINFIITTNNNNDKILWNNCFMIDFSNKLMENSTTYVKKINDVYNNILDTNLRAVENSLKFFDYTSVKEFYRYKRSE